MILEAGGHVSMDLSFWEEGHSLMIPETMESCKTAYPKRSSIGFLFINLEMDRFRLLSLSRHGSEWVL